MKIVNLADKEILKQLREHWDVLKKYGVKKVGLFGSFVSGTHNKKSDVDLVVEFKKPSFDNYIDLVDYLEDLFKRKVDILTPCGVKSIRIKKVAEEIKRSLIYA